MSDNIHIGSERPVCVHCGKHYGARQLTSERVSWKAGEPVPPHTGTGFSIVMKDLAIPYHGKIGEAVGAQIGFRLIWDGETYVTPAKPFCTQRCALDYARKAHARTTTAKLHLVKS